MCQFPSFLQRDLRFVCYICQGEFASSQQNTAPKLSYCGMKSQWYRPVPHVRHLFVISHHITKQTPNSSAHSTEPELKRSLQKTTLTYHSAWTSTPADGLLQLSSGAGGENKVGRFHLIPHHIWQKSVKRMEWETFCLCLFTPVEQCV